jgi:hypothetical protein
VLFLLILRLLPGGIAPSITGLYRRVLVARQLRTTAPPGSPGAGGVTPPPATGAPAKEDTP